MKFHEFVLKQMEPFGGMAVPGGQIFANMLKPIAELLIELSGERKDAVQSSALAWSATTPGERVAAVCRECATYSEVPTLVIIRAVWEQLFPRRRPGQKCQICHGDNFVSRDGTNGLTYAVPCDHSGYFHDPGMTLSSTQTQKYSEERARAQKSQDEWLESEAYRKIHAPQSEIIHRPARRFLDQVLIGERG
jgi:hypothetical protein